MAQLIRSLRKLAPVYRSMSCTMRSQCRLAEFGHSHADIVSFGEFFRPAPRLLTKVDSPQGLTLNQAKKSSADHTCCVRIIG